MCNGGHQIVLDLGLASCQDILKLISFDHSVIGDCDTAYKTTYQLHNNAQFLGGMKIISIHNPNYCTVYSQVIDQS